MNGPKVVCVGYQKTGTSSLGRALELLGYRVCGYDPFRDLARQTQEDMGALIRTRAAALARDHDAFKDTPWPILYRELDEWFPGSKFILITRDSDRWIRSVVTDFGNYENAIHRHIYGVGYPVGHEEVFVRRYEKHNEEVREYFKNRRDDLLDMHLDSGEVNWEGLCGFLGHPVPDVPWPHVNTASQKRKKMFRARLKRRMRRMLPWA